jgi:phage shock protein E
MFSMTEVIAVIAVIVAVTLLLKRAGLISPKDARTYLQNGALLIDVRTPGEFSSGHLPNAINLPLDQIETSQPSRVADKSQVILLHCQSGMRSGLAKRKLNRLGYSKAYNLGSYGRASQIVTGA